MARPNKEFLLAWNSLSGDDLNAGWRSISLKPSGPLDIRVGRRSPDNAEAVLIGFSAEYFSKTDKLPEGNGFSVELADFVDGNRMPLRLKCVMVHFTKSSFFAVSSWNICQILE